MTTLDGAGPERESVEQPATASSFEAFFRSEWPRAVALSLALTGDPATAEDVAQDAFAAAHVNWTRISRYDSPGGWLKRVVMNKSASARRRFNADRSRAERAAARPESSVLQPPPVMAGEVWSEVRKLPRRQAQLVALVYVDGESVAEAARVLGISDSAAATHLRRARGRLQAMLGDHR